MNHPTHEDWGLYLFGEAPPELNRKLKAHLNECGQCADEIAAMQRTMRKLDAWEVPPASRQIRRLEPLLKFAMAAAIVLGVGIGVGRLTPPPTVDVGQLRTELRASLLAESQAANDQVMSDCRQLVASTEARLAQQQEVAMRLFGRQLIEAVNTGRDQDRGAIQAAFDQFKQQREADYVSLRRDLETVASSTDQQLQLARVKLYELASTSNTRD
jgi:hypothetical protein